MHFENCFIRSLKLTKSESTRITLKNCHIHRIEFGDAKFEDFSIVDSALFNIDGMSQAGTSQGAFVGRVTVSNLWLPHCESEILREGNDNLESKRHKLIYEFRNIRMYLAKKGDLRSSGVFHAAELSLERKDDRGASWLLNYLYESISNYGNSVERSSLWVLFTLVAMFATSQAFEAINGIAAVSIAECGKDGAGQLGWLNTLCEKAWVRSATFPFYSLMNPFGLLSAKPLMVSATGLLAVIQGSLTLLGLTSLALFVLAVRRKFRLDKQE